MKLTVQMFSTTARFVRAHQGFAHHGVKHSDFFLLFQRRDLCRPYTVF